MRLEISSLSVRGVVGISIAFLLWSASYSTAMKHNFRVDHNSASLIGPVGPAFGFGVGGHFNLTIFDFELTVEEGHSETIVDEVEPGFFLKRYPNEASFNQHMALLRSNTTLCSFQHFFYKNSEYEMDHVHEEDDFDPATDPLTIVDDDFNYGTEILSAKDGIFYSMRNQKTWKSGTASIEYQFKAGEEGLYFLIYQTCPHSPAIDSTFELDFHFYNRDTFGNISYLSVGEMGLPMMYFYFSISYFLCCIIWMINIRQIQRGSHGLFAQEGERPVVYAIHQLMSLLMLIKFLTIFLESIRYHFIRVAGHAEIWTFLFYCITFVKGTFLFTVVLLLGTGWSFVKPLINEREKKIVFFVLCLQVLNNVGLIFISQETEGENGWEKWTSVLHIVDILCCCAILVPIVWQVNALEKSVTAEDEDVNISERELALEAGDKGEILSKLKLFRTFYLIVVAYIYSTRILVYLFSNLLNYKYIWVEPFVIEILSLAFYVSSGFMFRPQGVSSYQPIETIDTNDMEGKTVEMGSMMPMIPNDDKAK